MGEDGGVTIDQNLLGGPPPTYLPEDPGALALDDGDDPRVVAAANPTSSLAWATLAAEALSDDDPVAGYAFARTGYHRGLDALRRAGWKGHGPIPWEHVPNRGFLLSLDALRRAAAVIGEDEEATRCAVFLRESSPEAAAELGA